MNNEEKDPDGFIRESEGIGEHELDQPRAEAYKGGVDKIEMPKMDKSMPDVDKENIVVNVTKYSGGMPKYNNWTIEAEAWIEEDGEKKDKERMRVGIAKKTGDLKQEEVEERVKEEYIKLLDRDPERGKKKKKSSKSEEVLKNLKSKEVG